MEPQVVIHIGWHKSASTFLQNGFFRALDANYQPLAAFPPGQREKGRGTDSLIDFAESDDAFEPDAFRQMVLGTDEPRLTIISHEEISGHPHGYALIDPFVTARNLAAACPGAKIIAITRNQVDYILSLYCYRVSIRGHESRSLARFMREESEAGLLRHVQYDRVIGEYVRLFGRENVLVLPMEMIRADPSGFFRRLADFIGHTPTESVKSSSANASTRMAFVLALWRPVNALFATALRLTLLLRGENPADYEPRQRKIYPFLGIRYRYYALKRQLTSQLTRWFPRAHRVGPADIPDLGAIELQMAGSNARLFALGVIAWDMAKYGYPIESPRRSD